MILHLKKLFNICFKYAKICIKIFLYPWYLIDIYFGTYFLTMEGSIVIPFLAYFYMFSFAPFLLICYYDLILMRQNPIIIWDKISSWVVLPFMAILFCFMMQEYAHRHGNDIPLIIISILAYSLYCLNIIRRLLYGQQVKVLTMFRYICGRVLFCSICILMFENLSKFYLLYLFANFCGIFTVNILLL